MWVSARKGELHYLGKIVFLEGWGICGTLRSKYWEERFSYGDRRFVCIVYCAVIFWMRCGGLRQRMEMRVLCSKGGYAV